MSTSRPTCQAKHFTCSFYLRGSVLLRPHISEKQRLFHLWSSNNDSHTRNIFSALKCTPSIILGIKNTVMNKLDQRGEKSLIELKF